MLTPNICLSSFECRLDHAATGSLFNHDPRSPNVSYQLDHKTSSIKYTLVRAASAGDELCISYGAGRMWWEKDEPTTSDKETQLEAGASSDKGRRRRRSSLPPTPESEWAKMAAVGMEGFQEDSSEDERQQQPSRPGATRPRMNGHHTSDQGERSATPSQAATSTVLRSKSPTRLRSILGDCPLWRVTGAIDPMTIPLQLVDAWAIDVEARQTAAVISFAKQLSSATPAAKASSSPSLHAEKEDVRHLRAVRPKVDAAAELAQKVGSTSIHEGSSSGTTEFGYPGPSSRSSHVTALLGLVAPHRTESDVLQALRSSAPAFFSAESGPWPYVIQVPTNAAPCKARLKEWNEWWPVSVRATALDLEGPDTTTAASKMIDRQADRRHWQHPERLEWAKQGLRRCVRSALEARERGEVPIGVHVTENFGAAAPAYWVPYQSQGQGQQQHAAAAAASGGSGADESWRIEADAYDTRCSERNPIKHAVLNVIRNVADWRIRRERERDQTRSLLEGIAPHLMMQSSAPAGSEEGANGNSGEEGRRGSGDWSVRSASPGVAGAIAQQARMQRDGGAGALGETPSGTSAASEASSARSSPVPPPSREEEESKPAADGALPGGLKSTSTSTPPAPAPAPAAPRVMNGQDYLLNSLTLFTTHEPCAYCSMALVHSRVRAVYFLNAAPGAGGCCGAGLAGKPCEGMGDGGVYAVQEQSGLNHRFEVWRWMGALGDLGLDEEVGELLRIDGIDP